MRYNDPRYVATILRTLSSYFHACGYPDSWLLDMAEQSVASLWNWTLAREALEVFRSNREFLGWQEEALSFADTLLAREEVVWLSEEYVELTEVTEEEEEELPL